MNIEARVAPEGAIVAASMLPMVSTTCSYHLDHDKVIFSMASASMQETTLATIVENCPAAFMSEYYCGATPQCDRTKLRSRRASNHVFQLLHPLFAQRAFALVHVRVQQYIRKHQQSKPKPTLTD